MGDANLTMRFMDGYGPYAFGVLSLVIILTVCVWAAITMWAKVIRPYMVSQNEVAKQFATSTAELRSATDNVRDAASDLKVASERLAAVMPPPPLPPGGAARRPSHPDAPPQDLQRRTA